MSKKKVMLPIWHHPEREKRNRSVCSRIFPFTVYTVLLSAGIAGIHCSFHR